MTFIFQKTPSYLKIFRPIFHLHLKYYFFLKLFCMAEILHLTPTNSKGYFVVNKPVLSASLKISHIQE